MKRYTEKNKIRRVYFFIMYYTKNYNRGFRKKIIKYFIKTFTASVYGQVYNFAQQPRSWVEFTKVFK